MKHLLPLVFGFVMLNPSFGYGTDAINPEAVKPHSIKPIQISKTTLKDKIKGGWAGQTIGVSFGSYTEFRYNGTFIQDYQVIPWYEGYVKKLMLEWPDLFDDIYMDLTFVQVLEKEGMDAPVDSFANAFANASYNLWHANQAARYNILKGIKAPQSGHWLNNPHSDDIDYQIEADFAGLMNPLMPNSASKISDKVGHIMNYGDGWYGGVYVGAMYAMAFNSTDVRFVVSEALKTIPKNTTFYNCIADVIAWHKKYPNDWKQTWFEIQKKYSSENGCPEGIFTPLNIDAKVNSAYVVMGLLYGNGDFTRTMEISTRAGQDSDCNPSTAGGILGTILGYDKIPYYWKRGLSGSEDMDFKYTTMSLNKVYELSYSHALKNIVANGGKVNDDHVLINGQLPVAVKFEQGFTDVFPVDKMQVHNNYSDGYEFDFEGTAFVLRGGPGKDDYRFDDYVFDIKVYVDGKLMEQAPIPTSSRTRRYELSWAYQLVAGKHHVKMEIANPKKGYHIRIWEYLVYADKAIDGIEVHNHAGKVK
ncbi:MAG: ADP-ribosylglycohydrolase family protein [Pedobacter sp.]|nr:MAG: ADP-ribosylglycohydrolase family protein [Pedobacter sp.]